MQAGVLPFPVCPDLPLHWMFYHVIDIVQDFYIIFFADILAPDKALSSSIQL